MSQPARLTVDIDISQLIQRGVEIEATYPEDDFYELHNRSPSSSTPGSPTFENLEQADLSNASESEPEAVSHKLLKKRAKKAAKREKAREARKRRRLEEIADNFAINGNINAKNKYVERAEPLFLPFNFADSAVTESAYKGKRTGEFVSQKHYTLSELVGPQSEYHMKLITWDGFTPTPVYDCKGRRILVLAGHPDDPSWKTSNLQEANRLMEYARHRSRVSTKSQKHRRGEFTALRCGVSHGGGQVRPSNLHNNKSNQKLLDELNRSRPFERMAGFATSAFATWAPDLYAYYVKYAQKLYSKYPKLKRPFSMSAYSAVTYNTGPWVECFPHVDIANLPFGWCAVTALGDYDPTQGGHLVLWNLGLVIEFPPGSLILFPSATIVHSNTSIQQHERRYSFTHYTAGGLFGWVDQGFQTLVALEQSLAKKPKEMKAWKEERAKRWQFGLSLLPVLEESVN
ncbi:hypothetical protein CVT24_010958 [Panaeolus cyanescens]|uniref:Uncharacterized protein n=1 Tax=Panaeolus cyanescens TaxID=181874 RepID=A0A409YYG1_9AGAR|nr:hypothetical protein CVT24_010958 [Panaeolus cyanescens]